MNRQQARPVQARQKLSGVQQEELIRQYMPIVHQATKLLRKKFRYNVDRLELFEYGVLGLVRCLQSYQFDDRLSFQDYASEHIYEYVLKLLKKERPELFSSRSRREAPQFEMLQLARTNSDSSRLDDDDEAYERPSERLLDVFELDSPDPLTSLLNDESSALVQMTLKRLPHVQQEILRLTFYENVPSFEIARRLGMHANEVSDLRSGALRMMRRRLLQQN